MKVLGDKIKTMEFQADVLSSQVSKILSEAILEGVLEGGQKLVEMEIQEMFGISRSPLREAIRDLEKKGLVTIIPRKGAFVRRVTVKDIEDIFPVRAKLEALAAGLAHPNISPEDLDEMKDILDRMQADVKTSDTKSYWRHHAIFHEIFINASRNQVLIETLSRLRLHSLWYRFSYKYYEENLEKQYLIHEKIYKLFANRKANVEKLEKLVHDHIEIAFEKFVGYLTKKK
ncbi:MAG: GntR family transcriptional regulator [Desulfobacterales bacterium]|jgi:DNA-binding GntR family transcriptional regulator